jgi:hypothetical protein
MRRDNFRFQDIAADFVRGQLVGREACQAAELREKQKRYR